MARRRSVVPCSKDNLFAFKLDTLKYFTKAAKELAPAWSIPRARALRAELTPPSIALQGD